MSETAQYDIEFTRGEDYGQLFRWGAGGYAYGDISAVERKAPLQVTVVGHGLPPGWVVQLQYLPGLRGIDTERMFPVTVVDANTIAFRDINGALARGNYAGGGNIRYFKPVNLTGYTARAQMREYPEAPGVLLDLNTENGGITIDVALSAIQINFSAQRTKALPVDAGVYDLDLIAPGGQIQTIIRGNVRLHEEVTREN